MLTSSAQAATSGSAAESAATSESSVPASPSPVKHRTRLQSGIVKPKLNIDGSIRYSLSYAIGEPADLQEAVGNASWKHAMDEEYRALLKNKTWHLVNPPKGHNIIDCKCVYKIKRKAYGTIDSYKARLVAKGFRQRYGIDYEDTFSHVV